MYASGSLNENSFIIASYDSGAIFDVDLTTGKTTEIVPPLVPEDKLPVGNVFWIAMPNAYTKSGFL